jgi:branched-chain amino acid transport system ATP-binding protein
MSLLALTGVSKSFRGLRAVNDVSFALARGAIVALIGPNGAGKTTLFNLIAGVLRPDGGRIVLDGRSIAGLTPDRVCRAGVARTFQLVKPFAGLTVLENVTVGALRSERTVAGARAHARKVLARLGLSRFAEAPASQLTLADRKKLEVARALATRPVLLLLDEMMSGLRPAEIDEMVGVLQEVRKEDQVALLLTEHVMRAVVALAEQVVVLHHGEVIAMGPPAEVVTLPAVVQSYLGEEAVL